MSRRTAGDHGFALEATILLLVLMAGLIGAGLLAHLMVQRASGLDTQMARVTHAAEGGADHVMAQLNVAIQDGAISPAELAALTPPVIPGTTVSVTGTAVGPAVPGTIANGPYTGLIALNQRIDIGVTATDPARNRADAVVSVNAQSIPLFQFGVFYEEDLEIHNGPRMDFAGWVHSNGNIYLSSDNQYFQDMITTPGSLYWQRKAYNDRRTGVYINNASGVPVNLTFDSRSQPVPANFVNASQASFDGRVMTSAHGVTPLRLPLPPGMPAIELINPRDPADTPEEQAVKFAWKADWHITVDLSNLALGCLGAFANVGVVSPTGTFRTGGRTLPDPVTDCPLIFRFLSDAFHEGREHIGVDLLEVNLGALYTWIAGDPVNRRTAIIYITFVNAAPPSGGTPNLNSARDFPAVRLVNGAQLGAPLSLATDRPLYIQGNFNSQLWQPTSLLGDAVTFLSSAWSDGAHPWTPGWNPDGTTQSFANTNAARAATRCMPRSPPGTRPHRATGRCRDAPRPSRPPWCLRPRITAAASRTSPGSWRPGAAAGPWCTAVPWSRCSRAGMPPGAAGTGEPTTTHPLATGSSTSGSAIPTSSPRERRWSAASSRSPTGRCTEPCAPAVAAVRQGSRSSRHWSSWCW